MFSKKKPLLIKTVYIYLIVIIPLLINVLNLPKQGNYTYFRPCYNDAADLSVKRYKWYSFIPDIYIAPLQVGLLRSAPTSSTFE